MSFKVFWNGLLDNLSGKPEMPQLGSYFKYQTPNVIPTYSVIELMKATNYKPTLKYPKRRKSTHK
jgi:hypothetical protein